MSDIDWKNLQNFKCPVCDRRLFTGILEYQCKNRKCGFRISKKRFNEIVQDMYDQEEVDW